MASIGDHLVETQCAQAAFKETGFFGCARQGNGRAVADGSLLMAVKARQKVGPAGMERLIAVQFVLLLDQSQQAQTGLWAL